MKPVQHSGHEVELKHEAMDKGAKRFSHELLVADVLSQKADVKWWVCFPDQENGNKMVYFDTRI